MTAVTIVGNLTADPELKFTNGGKAVASFTVAESQRVKQPDGTWGDGPATFWRCTMWDTPGENLAESCRRGQRLIVVGEAKQRSFETRDGEKRTVIEVTANDAGPSLKWATVDVVKQAGNGSGFASKPRTPSGGGGDSDPWDSTPQVGADEVPPF